MFSHRRKTIGKSVYYIGENRGAYVVKEIYNGDTVGKSKYTHRTIDEALRELQSIRDERHYTDQSMAIRF